MTGDVLGGGAAPALLHASAEDSNGFAGAVVRLAVRFAANADLHDGALIQSRPTPHTQTQTHTRMHTHKHTHKHTQTHTHTHTHTHNLGCSP